MRILVALLVVLAVLYYWDANYNNGTLLDPHGTVDDSPHGALETA
jgi:hypothetical protein